MLHIETNIYLQNKLHQIVKMYSLFLCSPFSDWYIDKIYSNLIKVIYAAKKCSQTLEKSQPPFMLNEINMFYSFIKISIDSHHKQSTFPRRISNLIVCIYFPLQKYYLCWLLWYGMQYKILKLNVIWLD